MCSPSPLSSNHTGDYLSRWHLSDHYRPTLQNERSIVHLMHVHLPDFLFKFDDTLHLLAGKDILLFKSYELTIILKGLERLAKHFFRAALKTTKASGLPG